MLLTTSWILDLAIALVTGVYLLYWYISRKHKYWQNKGVYTQKPLPFLGNFKDVFLLRKPLVEWLKDQYKAADKKLDFFGVYILDEPFFVVTNPKLMKHFMTKDFSHFLDRNIAAPDHSPIVKNMMFFQKNPAWKSERSKITVAFSSGKLKKMFYLMAQSSEELSRFLAKKSGPLDAKDIAAKYSTNVISRCAFGINAHCFDDQESEFSVNVKKIFKFSLRNIVSQTCYFLKPSFVNLFKMEFIEKKVMDYICKVFINTFKLRENSNHQYEDLIDIIKELKKNEGATINENEDEYCGIAMMMFLAGFETTSSTIAYTLYELAMNPDIQEKVQKEINQVVEEHGGAVTYEALQNMQFLEMCIYETLRKYPVVPFLDRQCVKDYKIPGTEIVLEKGTPILFPHTALHMDEKYFPNPDKYDPERFKDKSVNDQGLVFIPFGDGPRNCIGERFGKISTKCALVSVLKNFQVLPCENTPKKVKFETKSLLLQSTCGLPVIFKQLDK